MKRSWLPLLLFPAAAGVAWFAISASFRAEREYADFVHELGADAETRVLDSRFTRGWLSSDAETSIEVSGATGLVFRAAMEDLGAREVRDRIGMRMRHHIEHGWLPLLDWARGGFQGRPLLAHVRSTIEIDQESQQALGEVVGMLPQIDVRTELHSGGEAHGTLSMAAAPLRAKGPGFERSGRWLGFDGEVTLSEGYKHANGTLRSQGFQVSGLDRTLDVRDVALVFDWPGHELPLGRMTLEIDQIAVGAAVAGVPSLVFDDVGVQAETELQGGRFGGTLSLGTQAVTLGASRFGPGALRFALEDVDAQALRQLRRAGLRIQAHQRTDDPATFALVAVDLLEALPQLLAGGPRIGVQQLQLMTPQGPMQGKAEALLAPRDAGTPEQALAAYLRGEAEVSAPRALLDALIDAHARSHVAAQGGDVTDDTVRAQAASDLEALRASGLALDGDHVRWRHVFGSGLPPRATPASEPPPTLDEATIPASAPAPARSETAQPAEAKPAPRPNAGPALRRARAPIPPGGAPETAPAAPSPDAAPAAPSPSPEAAPAAPAPAASAPGAPNVAPAAKEPLPDPAAEVAPAAAKAALPDPAGEVAPPPAAPAPEAAPAAPAPAAGDAAPAAPVPAAADAAPGQARPRPTRKPPPGWTPPAGQETPAAPPADGAKAAGAR